MFLFLLVFNNEKLSSFKSEVVQNDFKNFESYLDSEIRISNVLSSSLYNFSAITTLDFYLNKLSKTELIALKSHLDSNSENVNKFIKTYNIYDENVKSKFYLKKTELLYAFSSNKNLIYPFFDDTIEKDTTLTKTLLELTKNNYDTYISEKIYNDTLFFYVGKKLINHEKCKGYIILKSSYKLKPNIKFFDNINEVYSLLNINDLSNKIYKKDNLIFFIKNLKKENKDFYLIEYIKSDNTLSIIFLGLLLIIFIIMFYIKKIK
ncbi:hypothetical protein [Tepiditoga spiralis]|uniref:hypothetical protein n=1 Tax=Tepiditoga spiralis TaxID=2108365 RepID=UPI0016863D6D|nr:hypothetical protein [Tepiditoga spiralis]